MAKQGNFKGSLTRGKQLIEVDLNMYSWKDDNVYFVYSPALDLTGYGYTLSEAKDSFEHLLAENFTYMVNKDTLYAELERLGWTVNRRKKRVKAPGFEELIEDNDEFAKLVTRKDVSTEQRPVQMAL